MNILILGAGRIGSYLAKKLSEEKHNVTILDVNEESINYLKDTLDIIAIAENDSNISLLLKSDLSSMDLLLAVTGIDEVNIMSCYVAKKYGIKTRIARVHDNWEEHSEFFSQGDYHVDFMINPEKEACNDIMRLIHSPVAIDIEFFFDRRVVIKGYRITPILNLVGLSINDFIKRFPVLERCVFVALVPSKHSTNDNFYIKGEDTLNLDDVLYLLLEDKDTEEVSQIFQESSATIARAFIVGANRITEKLIPRLLAENVKITLIDASSKEVDTFKSKFPKISAHVGIISDIEFLNAKGLQKSNVFVAVGDDEEENFISCLLAKQEKVPKTLAMIHKSDYLPLINVSGIDGIISLRLSASRKILKYLHKGNILFSTVMKEDEGNVIEYTVDANSRLKDKAIENIPLSVQSAKFLAVMRHGDVFIMKSKKFTFREGDRVLVFVLSRDLINIESSF